MLASESALVSEREELEGRLCSLEKVVEEKSKKLENFEQKNVRLEKSLQEEVERSSNLVKDHNVALENHKKQIEEIQLEMNKKVNFLKTNFCNSILLYLRLIGLI